MAVQDLWFKRDGSRTAAYGQGRRWRVRYHGVSRAFDDPPRKQPSPKDRPPRDAEVFWAKLITEQPCTAGSTQVTIDQLLDRWLATKGRLSESGQTGCRNGAAHCRPRWGSMRPDEVTGPAVEEWAAGLQGGASLQIKTIQALSGALRIAVREKMITENPCADITYPKERPREAHYLTEQQVAKLAWACGEYRPMIWFMASTGLRIGEVIALNVGDVNRRTGRVRVRSEDVGASKGDARDVGVPPKVIGMLDLGRRKSAPLFPGVKGGRLSYRWWRQHRFDPGVWLAWLDGVHPHDLRHTAVSLAAANGVHPMVTQRMVGHKRPIMTGRYAHLYDADLDTAAVKLDNLIPDE